jgi:uncharacterized membrane protein
MNSVLTGLLIGFCVFVGLCLLAIWWAFRAARKSLDRHFEMENAAWNEALRRLPP